MSEAEKNTREWRVRLDSRSTGPIGWLFAVDVALVEPEDAQEDVIVVPKSALTAALEERDEAKQIIANFTACLEEDPRYVAMRNKAERAEAALTAAEVKWRNLKERESDGRIEQEHCVELAEKERDEAERALEQAQADLAKETTDRERAEAALAEALDVIEAVVAGIVTLDGARVVLRKHGRLP